MTDKLSGLYNRKVLGEYGFAVSCSIGISGRALMSEDELEKMVKEADQVLCDVKNASSLGNSLKMQQKNRPYKRIQQVGEKNVHFKIVQGNFPEKRA